jgi:ferredoxin
MPRPEAATRKVADDEAMPREAARCLRCDSLCEICVTVCPNRAIVALPSFLGPIARGDVHRAPDGSPPSASRKTAPWPTAPRS